VHAEYPQTARRVETVSAEVVFERFATDGTAYPLNTGLAETERDVAIGMSSAAGSSLVCYTQTAVCV